MNEILSVNDLISMIKSKLDLETKGVQILGASESWVELVIQAFLQYNRDLLIIVPHQKEVIYWKDYLDNAFHFHNRDIHLLPISYFHVWGPEKFTNQLSLRYERMTSCFFSTMPGPKLIITTLQALSQFTLSKNNLFKSVITLRKDRKIDQDSLELSLKKIGYRKALKVDEKGYYSIRGAIFDVFPIQENLPIRIEWMEDTIQSIKTFDLHTQRSSEEKSEFSIIPCLESLGFSNATQKLYNFLLEKNVNSLEVNSIMSSLEFGEKLPVIESLLLSLDDGKQPVIDYISPSSIAIFPDGIQSCKQNFIELRKEAENLSFKDIEFSHAVPNPDQVYLSPDVLIKKLDCFFCLEFSNPLRNAKFDQLLCKSSGILNLKTPKEWLVFIEERIEERGSVLILCEHEDQVSRAESYFKNKNEKIEFDPNALGKFLEAVPLSEGLTLGLGKIRKFLLDEIRNLLILNFRDIFSEKADNAKENSRKLKSILSSFRDLSLDDLVVHIDHGIGLYKGIVELDLIEYKGDFLVVEYKGFDKLYLPVQKLNLLQKYKKEEKGSIPPLDKLGSDAFLQRKVKVLKAAENVAEELLKNQASRKTQRSHVFSEPNDMYLKFVEEFPYQETEDQLRCLQDIENDFKSQYPMDRLLVGDVGFGKTEVAIRAALRSILEGYQVMFLAPTTVLSYQHFSNFRYRFEKLGVRIAQLHRLIKKKEQNSIIEQFNMGSLDFLIGTHRLLSGDLKPKNLGLVIVDEEQRFGVMQKEKLKKLKSNVDLLSLSATPIPRTLHMALLGLRDISLIVTPPPNRMPVRTIVTEFDVRLIKSVIEAELQRGGQVFYLHNRVDNIEITVKWLSELIPKAKIRFVHGRMHENMLDAVIIDFVEQKFNVLVCTTIIESGIDMPNVNSLIIENSEKFGLAQLHQLRGRVGRSSIQAYAYFLTNSSNSSKETHQSNTSTHNEAMKRLEYLMTHQGLGSGFQLANNDLELRGSGNLIGKEQSGEIAGVGLELYVEMLEEKIKSLSSVKVEKKVEPEIKVKVTGIIPKDYISDDKERLDIYKQLFSANVREEIDEIVNAACEFYGKPPIEFKALCKIAVLRLVLRQLKAEAFVEITRNTYELRFFDKTKEKLVLNIPGILRDSSDDVRLIKILNVLELRSNDEEL